MPRRQRSQQSRSSGGRGKRREVFGVDGKPLEWTLQARVKEQAELHIELFCDRNGFHWHIPDSREMEKGLPDSIVLLPERLIFIENKRHNGKVSAVQRRVLEMLRQVKTIEVYVLRQGTDDLDGALLDQILPRPNAPDRGGR